MALTKCKECGKEISSNAVNCPGCGNPLTQSSPATKETMTWEKFWEKEKKFFKILGVIVLVSICVQFLPTNEEVAVKEIKKSDTYNEAAKGLAKVEAEIKVEEALLAYIQKDYKTAYKLLSPIAEQGNDKAQYKLGIMYSDGQGVPQDYKEAGKWFRLAAEQENHKAELSLGFLYKDGKGVTKDSEEAMKLFTLAAEGGIPLAQNVLGLLLQAKGLENEKEDYILAHKWLNLSISNFDARTQSAAINSAKKTRSEIEKELTPSQLEEAQKLAKEWMESHSK